MKQCSRCKEWFALDMFCKNRRMKDGLNIYCRDCHNRNTRQWRDDNRPAYHEHRAAYYKQHAEKLRAARRSYYARNREVLRAKSSADRRANPAKYYNQDRLWRIRHPDKHRIKVDLRRARELSAEGRYTVEEWKALCDKYDNRCLCCGRQVQLTADHIVPLTCGGSNWIDNIQPLCFPCNSSKGTKTIDYRPAEESV